MHHDHLNQELTTKPETHVSVWKPNNLKEELSKGPSIVCLVKMPDGSFKKKEDADKELKDAFSDYIGRKEKEEEKIENEELEVECQGCGKPGTYNCFECRYRNGDHDAIEIHHRNESIY